MPTQILKVVKPDGSGDYTTLAQAITAQAQNLVTGDKYLSIEIDGDWSGGADTSVVNITGYTTDATHYIEIFTTSAARHPGHFSTTAYRLVNNSGAGNLFHVSNIGFVHIRGIQIQMTGSGDFGNSSLYVQYDSSNVGGFIMDGCIVLCSSGKALRYVDFGVNNQILITNSIFISNSAGGNNTSAMDIALNGHVSQYFFSNIVAVVTSGTGAGFNIYGGGASTVAVINSYAYSSGGSSYLTSGGNVVTNLTTCASEDATGTSGLTSMAYGTSTGAKFTNVTSGSENFTPQAGSPLIGAGTDESGTFTNDILDNVRGDPWTVGPFQISASSSSSSCRSSSSSSSCRSSSSSSRSSSSSSCSSSSSSSCRSSSSSSCSSSKSSSSSCSSSSSRSSSSSSRSSSSSSRSSSSSSSSCRSSSSSCSSRSSSSSSSSSCRSSSSSSSSSCRSSSSSSSSKSSSSSSRSSSSSSSKSSSSCSSSSSALLGTSKDYTRQDVTSVPTNNNDLGTAFSPTDYTAVQFLDGVTVSLTSINNSAVFLFKDQAPSKIPFAVTWVGKSNKATTEAPIFLQIYNISSGLWETLASDTTTPANTNITLTGSKLSTVNNYYSGTNIVSCRVYQPNI